MPLSAWLAFAGFAVTTIGLLVRVLIAIGELKMPVALLWAWYLSECGPGMPGGRRRTDPPAHFAYAEPPPGLTGPDEPTSRRAG